MKEQFREEMLSEDFSNWLYNGATAENVGDLGYFMGYAICRAYYNNAMNKEKAIAGIIEPDYAHTDAVKAFLIIFNYGTSVIYKLFKIHPPLS